MAAAAVRLPRVLTRAAARRWPAATVPLLMAASAATTGRRGTVSRGGPCRVCMSARFSSSSLSSSSSVPSPGAPSSVTIDGRTYETDAWFNAPPNVVEASARRLHLQKDHPLAITRQIFESQFAAPTFRHVNSLHPVVSTFQNFDSLGFAADHPGRSRTDTYYVNATTLLRTHTSAHELESFAANADAHVSDGFLLTADVYRRDEVDRTHYPVFHQVEGARVWDRRRQGDATGDLAAAIRADLAALPTHGVVVEDPNPPFDDERNPRQAPHHSAAEVEALGAHLKRSLELLVVDVFSRAMRAGAQARKSRQAKETKETTEAKDGAADEAAPLRMRWVEAFFPFTSPSWELEVFYEGDWLEVLGCGISKQPILDAAGVPSQIGWAFGAGLDRIAMLLFRITDIRLFWSRDPRFLRQFEGVSDDLDKLRQFVPFSKYPACYKDVSFWLPPDAGRPDGPPMLHSNDVMEVIRSIAGDIVEDVAVVDTTFVHPKTARHSHTYRINYRSLEQTLTNAEVNGLHKDVCDALIGRLGVEIR